MNPIISAQELNTLIEQGAHNLVILDASFQLKGDLTCHEKYKAAHIGGAQFFDITEIKDHNNPIPNMLPPVADFETYVSARGIDNQSEIIIYGQDGMVMGPARAWWMFAAFGHGNVRVLDGGLKAWQAKGLPVTNELQKAISANFQAKLRPELVIAKPEIENAIENPNISIVDARSADRFLGKMPEPRPNMKTGHIPNSINLPASLFINKKASQIKSIDEIQTILKNHNIRTGSQIITTCGSGVTACFLSLVLKYVGYGEIPVYDGSWSEWGLCVAQ